MRVVSIALSASVVASLVSSVAASYNNNESSNPHHHKPRYLAKAAKSSTSSEGSKSNKGSSGSKSGKGSKGASTPTIPPSVDTFDDESSGAPTSNPTSAPTSAPTGCERSCTNDEFTVTSARGPIYALGFGTLLGGATYDGNMIENDNLCGDDVLISEYSGTGEQILFCSDLDCGDPVPTDTLYFIPGAENTGTFTVSYQLNNVPDSCQITVTVTESTGIEKGESEGIGFDPRAFELDEEEDLDFLMSMSMSM